MKLNTLTTKTDQEVLSFALFTQGAILIAFACLSYFRQEMLSVLFYMSLGVAIVVCFVVYKVFESQHLAKSLLFMTLVAGFVYAILVVLDPLSLIWCLTALPILIGVCDYPRNLYLSASLFGIAALVLFQEASIDQSNTLSVSTTLQFLFMILVVTIIGFSANKLRLAYLVRIEELSSLVIKMKAEDTLTGLKTRRYVESCLRDKFLKAEKLTNAFSVIIADIDNFRSINERYGHPVGDSVLSSVGAVIKKTLGDDCVFGRWDGNTIIIIPHSDAEATLLIAEVLREKISRLKPQTQGDTLTLSFSLGIASSAKCHDSDDLLSHAENSLYQAKNMGGNNVVIG
jgi:diguanylate cyclase (GGDEF)-like protein